MSNIGWVIYSREDAGNHYEPELEHEGYPEGSGRGCGTDSQFHAEHPADRKSVV